MRGRSISQFWHPSARLLLASLTSLSSLSVDATLLGNPLSIPALDLVLAAKTRDLECFSTRLQLLTAHSAFFLLWASISIPRLVYFLRCALAFVLRGWLVAYDEVLKTAVETILNCSLSPEAWMQSSLPVGLGGLGIRQTVHTAIL